MSELAILGGKRAVTLDPGDMFTWPIITREDEEAVLEVLRRRAMSDTDITSAFEEEFAAWMGQKYAVACSSGTAALQAAMYAVGLRAGDELICPSMTYWASCLQAFSLRATVVFADIDPQTYCIDPNDIERRIGPRTKAIMAVHYLSHPADMDAIMAIARRHNLKVIEDVSHAQGGLYKGKKLGTFGDAAAMSLMTGKSFATGEMGILTTNDRRVWEHALALGRYELFNAKRVTESEDILPYCGLPLGGYKYRPNQMSSALGRVQLKYYDARIAEIDRAMNYFLDGLEGLPGVRPLRPKDEGSTMGGWYCAHAHYLPEELHGLSVTRFVQALLAEGVEGGVFAGANRALHTHPIMRDMDIYGDGRPTRVAFAERDVRQLDTGLEVSAGLGARTFGLPWFK
ncbi:MAG: DegT/DnrJ/EryC1/StrS family aminotransferase, partial [Clostridia bacterium]|nr:DegT/DnrJ/EryC1/StrS family aminotransferase [Clostridia bacterium]